MSDIPIEPTFCTTSLGDTNIPARIALLLGSTDAGALQLWRFVLYIAKTSSALSYHTL